MSVKELKNEIDNNNGVRTKISILTYRIGFFEFYIYKNKIVKIILNIIYKILKIICLILCCHDIPSKQVYIDFGVRLPHGFDNTKMNVKTRIGKNCTIFHNVTIGEVEGKDVVLNIGDNCYIGAYAMILGKCVIGNDCKIGAGTKIINKKVPNKSTVINEVSIKCISQQDNSTN